MNCIFLTLSCLLIWQASAQSADEKFYTYTQAMKSCLGLAHVDRQTTRLITAVRRCEQSAPIPLRDQALETIIAELQKSRNRIIYVPVPTTSFPGNGFPFGSNNINTFPDLNRVSNTGFNNQNQFSTNPFNDPFNNLQSSRLGNNNLGNSINNNNNNNFNRATRRPGTTNNPFGFGQGKQASSEPAGETATPNKHAGEGDATSRQRRQLSHLNGGQLHQAKLEALHYLSNMTCVLRAANYIDHNNLPNYQFYENELRSLQMSRDLRNDMATGLIFCKELSQCMPVERLSHPLARELGQYIAYSRCLARTSMKACRKDDERRTQGNYRLTGAFFSGNGLNLLESVVSLGLDDDALGFEFF